MILLMIWDGLRPEMVTPELTPFLYHQACQGALCLASHAVFPTSTRINSASLSTGCYSGRHGIVDQELYVPAIDQHRAVSCGDWRVLQQLADLEGGRLLDPPTLGELLWAAGRRIASAGAGPSGATLLADPTLAGSVVNWGMAWPSETRGRIQRHHGAFLGSESTSSERNAFVLRVAQQYLWPEHHPDVLIIWLDEPDAAQHAHGLGSWQATTALAQLDQQLACFVGTLEEDSQGEDLTCMFLSDHGFSTLSGRVDPNGRLASAGLKASPESSEILCISNSLYLTGEARGQITEVIRFLQEEAWIGALFLRDDLCETCPDVMPQSAVFAAHRRSPQIMFSYPWSCALNDQGVAGCALGASPMVATHGSASPYDIHSVLLAWGAGIKQGVVSSVPCSIVDVAPTVLCLLGIRPPDGMQGRVVHEILEGGPPPETVTVSREARTCLYRTPAGPRRQAAQYSCVDGHRYLDQVSISL